MSLRKPPELTPALLAAARNNAQHSTGPRSATANPAFAGSMPSSTAHTSGTKTATRPCWRWAKTRKNSKPSPSNS